MSARIAFIPKTTKRLSIKALIHVCCYINKEIMTEKLIVQLHRNTLCCGR